MLTRSLDAKAAFKEISSEVVLTRNRVFTVKRLFDETEKVLLQRNGFYLIFILASMF
jgi:hypothetical protein